MKYWTKERWEEAKAKLRAAGIRDPYFATVDPPNAVDNDSWAAKWVAADDVKAKRINAARDLKLWLADLESEE